MLIKNFILRILAFVIYSLISLYSKSIGVAHSFIGPFPERLAVANAARIAAIQLLSILLIQLLLHSVMWQYSFYIWENGPLDISVNICSFICLQLTTVCGLTRKGENMITSAMLKGQIESFISPNSVMHPLVQPPMWHNCFSICLYLELCFPQFTWVKLQEIECQISQHNWTDLNGFFKWFR